MKLNIILNSGKKIHILEKKIHYMTYIEKIYNCCYKRLTKTEMEIEATVMYPCLDTVNIPCSGAICWGPLMDRNLVV